MTTGTKIHSKQREMWEKFQRERERETNAEAQNAEIHRSMNPVGWREEGLAGW